MPERANDIAADRIARARAVQVANLVARAGVKLRRDGRDLVGLCPFHPEKTPSFRVSPDWNNFKCFGCEASGDAIEFMRRWESLTFVEAMNRLIGGDDASVRQVATVSTSKPGRDLDDQARTAKALKGFNRSVPLTGTIGENYLVRRIGRLMAWPDDLRFNPEVCREFNGQFENHPAIIALLRDARTNEPRAVQRIFLKPDGADRLRDAKGRTILGPSTGAVIKLSPGEDVTLGLGIGEGVEKCVSLLAAGWSPMWCSAGTSGLSGFPALPGIEALSIFADHDEPGQKAARVCAQRWSGAGAEVRIVTPKTKGTDWSDALQVSP